MPRTKDTSNKLKASKKPSATKASKPVSKGDKIPVILVLAQFYKMGNERPTRKVVSQLTGYPIKSLSTTLLNLKKNDGYVEYDTETVWLTDKGLKTAKEKYGEKAEKAVDTESVHQTLIDMHKITGSKRKIFDLLKERPMTDEELMKSIGCHNKKSFGTYTSALNSAKITESTMDGTVKTFQLVESTCFPFGRPKA